MTERIDLAGSFTLSARRWVNRMGYGAMQLAGRDGNKLVWGLPGDIDAAIALLRDAVASGVNHGASILAVFRRCVSKAKARIVSASKSFRSNAHARY